MAFAASELQRQLHSHVDLQHLRVRAHGQLLIIESGDPPDAVRHARFRRQTVNLWSLEMAAYGGRWEPTPFRDTQAHLCDLLVGQFGWVLDAQDAGAEPGAD